jgi:hypothetical protein
MQTPAVSFPKGSFEVRAGFSCVSRNLIYTIVCLRCHKKYIGETGRRLGDRFREHIYDISRHSSSPVAVHFNAHDHEGIADIRVTGLLSCSSDDRNRLSLENRMIFRLGTLSPLGLNVNHNFF